MGFNIMDLMNGATRAAVEGVDNYEAITLNLDEIKVTKHNRYSMDDLEELATSILMDGLQEPLIIGRVNGEYLLSGGHRRREALVILQNEGHTEITQNIPCRFKDMTETQFRLSLLIGNTFNRKMTDYDLMNQAADWKEVLTQARKEKLLVLEEGKRVRDYVAAVLGEKPTKIAQLEAINNNATEEVKEQFEKGNMKITSAYETSRLSEDAQKEVAAAVEAGADIKSEEIKQMSEEKKKKRKTAEDIAKEQNVSDTDTSEEEYMAMLNAQGYKTAVCYGAEEAGEEILAYLTEPGRMPKKACVNAPWINGKCDGINLPSRMFSREECRGCKNFNPGREERIINEILSEHPEKREIKQAIINLSCGQTGNKKIESMEDTLEIINATLGGMVKGNELTVEQSAAVLTVAMKAYEVGKKARIKA